MKGDTGVYTWLVLRVGDHRVEIVDAWPTLGGVIWEMACSSWEEPGNRSLSFVVDETGQVAATAIFGPDESLLVTLSDGRRFRFPEPELYRMAAQALEAAPGGRA